MSETEFLIGRSGLDLQDDFYPDDLPSEWRFDYYYNMFRTLSLPIDTDEDFDIVFDDLEEGDDEFELVVSIEENQLENIESLITPIDEHKDSFTLFCEVSKTPEDKVLSMPPKICNLLLIGYAPVIFKSLSLPSSARAKVIKFLGCSS